MDIEGNIRLHLLTEDFLLDEETMKSCNALLEVLKRKISNSKLGNQDCKEFDAYIGIGDHSSGSLYYLVNHGARSIFWLDEVDLNGQHLTSGIPIQSEAHLCESIYSEIILTRWVFTLYFSKYIGVLLLDTYQALPDGRGFQGKGDL